MIYLNLIPIYTDIIILIQLILCIESRNLEHPLFFVSKIANCLVIFYSVITDFFT